MPETAMVFIRGGRNAIRGDFMDDLNHNHKNKIQIGGGDLCLRKNKP
jgi:hypothetical protein